MTKKYELSETPNLKMSKGNWEYPK